MANPGDIIFDRDLTIGGPRATLKPEKFDKLLEDNGYRVIWEQGMFCSCIKTFSGQPDYLCPACQGKGYIYINATQTRMFFSSVGGTKHQERIGLNDTGYAYVTPMTKDMVGHRDRITFLDFTAKYSQVLLKEDHVTPITLSYPVKSMLAMRVLNQVYTEGVDFNIDPDDRTKLVWLTESVPISSHFSLLYTVAPVYIVVGIEHEIRGTYTVEGGRGGEIIRELPKRFQVKREDALDGI